MSDVFVGEFVVCGGAASASGLSGPSDGAGDRGDPSALPGQEETHPGRHRGQKTAAAELLRRNCRAPYSNIWMFPCSHSCWGSSWITGHSWMWKLCEDFWWSSLWTSNCWRRTSTELFSVWRIIIIVFDLRSTFPLFFRWSGVFKNFLGFLLLTDNWESWILTPSAADLDFFFLFIS